MASRCVAEADSRAYLLPIWLKSGSRALGLTIHSMALIALPDPLSERDSFLVRCPLVIARGGRNQTPLPIARRAAQSSQWFDRIRRRSWHFETSLDQWISKSLRDLLGRIACTSNILPIGSASNSSAACMRRVSLMRASERASGPVRSAASLLAATAESNRESVNALLSID